MAHLPTQSTRARRRLASDLCVTWRFGALVLLALSACTAQCDDQGELQRLEWRATTEAYNEAALEVLLKEVNEIARELGLPEKLPIKRSDLLEKRVNTPFWADHTGQFGFVSTSNYYYYASAGDKLNCIIPNFGTDDVLRPAYMESLRRRYVSPRTQMDTNAAYEMATQWLSKADMDIQALEHDAEKVDISAWEIGGKFVPIYVVRWQQLAAHRGDNGLSKYEPIASVHFIAPQCQLLQMDVNQTKYIKRKPVTVADRYSLLQKTDDPKLRELWFTTEAYKAAALEVMLKEVNWAAGALRLQENLPIQSSNLTAVIIGTPYTADHQGSFATVFTGNYSYGAGQKLTAIGRSHRYPEEERHYLAAIRTRYTIPRTQANSNAVYTLAAHWLTALSVDLKRLEADYPCRISVPWNLGELFVPLYTVEWSKRVERSSRREVAVKMEILEPERSLEHLVIEKPEYMTRASLIVPDRAKLLKQ
jgi:hypothetical protein